MNNNSETYETVVPEGMRVDDFPFGELLDVNDVAALLRIEPKTVKSWVAHKKIPHIKICNSLLRFRRSELIEFIKNQPTIGGGK